MLIDDYGLDSDFLKSSLDEEESSRVEQEENQTLIIVDTAVSEVQKDDTLIFYTMPLGIIITDHYVFTIPCEKTRSLTMWSADGCGISRPSSGHSLCCG